MSQFNAKSYEFYEVAVVYVKGSAYRIQCLSEDDAISIMNNSNLVYKKGVLQFIFFIIYKKWVSATDYPLKEMIIEKKLRRDTK